MPTILIVDDDAALRDSLAETVHDLGYQARLATSGREALGVLASNEIHGVLLDLRMPCGMDGIEVLRRIRAQTNGPPVVILTAFASAENTIEATHRCLRPFDEADRSAGTPRAARADAGTASRYSLWRRAGRRGRDLDRFE
jgi:CheY-like chemotaxis protein